MVSKGKVIYRAKLAKDITATLRQQIILFIISIGIVALLLFLLLLGLNRGGDPYDINHIISLIGILVFTSIFLLVIWLNPLTTSIIYEKGVSSDGHTIIDKVFGYTFHPFPNITRIGYGTHHLPSQGIDSEFIVIYEASRRRATTSFRSVAFEDNFIDILKRVLTEKCPDAEWVEVDFNSLSWKLRH